MAISDYFDTTINIRRLTATTGAKKAFADVATNVAAHIQPLTAEIIQNSPYIFGKDFQLFTNDQTIQEGDRITDASGEYKVIAVEEFNFRGKQRHSEIIIRIFDEK